MWLTSTNFLFRVFQNIWWYLRWHFVIYCNIWWQISWYTMTSHEIAPSDLGVIYTPRSGSERSLWCTTRGIYTHNSFRLSLSRPLRLVHRKISLSIMDDQRGWSTFLAMYLNLQVDTHAFNENKSVLLHWNFCGTYVMYQGVEGECCRLVYNCVHVYNSVQHSPSAPW